MLILSAEVFILLLSFSVVFAQKDGAAGRLGVLGLNGGNGEDGGAVGAGGDGEGTGPGGGVGARGAGPKGVLMELEGPDEGMALEVLVVHDLGKKKGPVYWKLKFKQYKTSW